MPQSLSCVYVHSIFSTKDREPFLVEKQARLDLHSYLGEVSKRIGCQPLIVGGADDHVHILAALGRTITQADWIKELKRTSSAEMKVRLGRFAWQSGYAIFSVDPSNMERVRHYIAGQEEHHRKVSFQDELRAIMREHGVKWNEDYLWD